VTVTPTPDSEPWDDDYDDDFDPATSPPEGWEVMSDAQRRELLGDDNYPVDPAEDADEGGAFPELIEAGFVHRYPVPGATGFRAGGAMDQMLPGADLAWHLGAARQRGLGQLSDDELIGFLDAARRGEAWQAAMVLAATAELDARRAGPGGREGEHVDDELAAALTLTARGARAQLELSRQLERLPHTAGLLAAGIIDRARAAVIARQLGVLDDAAAAAVDAVVAPRAGQMTTGMLSARCRGAADAHDPQAALRRKQQAEKDARVECWAEDTGTAALSGRDLDRAAVIAADKSLDQAARWLRARGAEATMDQLRAAVFLARLTGQPLRTFLPPSPAAPGTPGTAAGAGAGGGGGGAGLAGISGINLTVPLATWLGLAERPGQITGTGAAGPADADTCRTLADALARDPATRWCITVLDRAGRAVGHGCARAGPGPPGTGPRAWLATIKITPIATGSCAHRHQSAAYQPSPALRHRIKIRSPRCGFPGCRRPARRCDDDHTIPHHLGGRTCECNLHPLCRHHHQAKQAHGWHLAQPEPGILVWTTPSARQYTVTAEPYPG